MQKEIRFTRVVQRAFQLLESAEPAEIIAAFSWAQARESSIGGLRTEAHAKSGANIC